MTKQQTRLELLKLVHRIDHTPEGVIERAKALEMWMLEDQDESALPENDQPKRKPGRPIKTGNASILD